MESDNIGENNIKNINEIIQIMKTRNYINLQEIRILTGCSDRQARILREECLSSYLFGNMLFDSRQLSLKGIRIKVRLDKFLEYYDNKILLNLFNEIRNMKKGIEL